MPRDEGLLCIGILTMNPRVMKTQLMHNTSMYLCLPLLKKPKSFENTKSKLKSSGERCQGLEGGSRVQNVKVNRPKMMSPT